MLISLYSCYAIFLHVWDSSYLNSGLESYKLPVYMNPSITYFGSSHIGYAVITLLVVVLINPIILLFPYLCQCFHKCVNHLLPPSCLCRCLSGVLQDRTNGSQDCRYFVSAFQDTFTVQGCRQGVTWGGLSPPTFL